MKILVINNHGQYNHRIQRTLRYLKIPSELVANTLSLDEIMAENPIGLILGGGPSVDRAGNSRLYIEHLNLPILGICLGHQLIAQAFGGEISTAEAQSYAQIDLEILDEDDIFLDLAPIMKVWASHKDEVKKIPNVFEILAQSSICEVEAFKHKQKPIYGIQFHPEVFHTENGTKIFENFYNVCKTYDAQD